MKRKLIVKEGVEARREKKKVGQGRCAEFELPW